jgi:hypothetical protein
MALVLPMLLLAIGGLVDLGRAFYGQIILGNAAREGVRMVAMGYPNAAVSNRVNEAVTGISPLVGTSVSLTPVPDTCPNPLPPNSVEYATLSVKAENFNWLMLNVVPSLVGATVPTPTLTAKATMRCAG